MTEERGSKRNSILILRLPEFIQVNSVSVMEILWPSAPDILKKRKVVRTAEIKTDRHAIKLTVLLIFSSPEFLKSLFFRGVLKRIPLIIKPMRGARIIKSIYRKTSANLMLLTF